MRRRAYMLYSSLWGVLRWSIRDGRFVAVASRRVTRNASGLRGEGTLYATPAAARRAVAAHLKECEALGWLGGHVLDVGEYLIVPVSLEVRP